MPKYWQGLDTKSSYLKILNNSWQTQTNILAKFRYEIQL